MPISIKWVLCVTTFISTGASLAGGLFLYFESLSSLKDTVNELSLSQTEALHTRLIEFYSVPQEQARAHQSFLYGYDWSALENAEAATRQHVYRELTKWWQFSLVRESKMLQEVGVICLTNEMSDANDTSFFYHHVWYDLKPSSKEDGTFERNYVHAVRDGPQSNRLPEPFLINVTALDSITGEDKLVGYNFSAKSYHTRISEWKAINQPSWGKATWRPPQMWVDESVPNGITYLFQAYDMIFDPPKPPNPLSACDSVLISGYMIYFSWFEILQEHKRNNQQDTVVVVDGSKRRVFADSDDSNVLYNEGKEEGCYINDPASHSWIHCLRPVDKIVDRRTRDAAVYLLDDRDSRRIHHDNYTINPPPKFSEREVGGEQHFIRRKDVFYFEYVDEGTDPNREGTLITVIDPVIIWLRPTSVVKHKVTRAVTFLLVFVGIVFFVDVVLAAIEIILIARPMRRISLALQTAGKMEDLEEAQAIGDSMGHVYIEEVARMKMSFFTMTDWLFAYRPFIPEGVRRDTGKAFLEDEQNPLVSEQTMGDRVMQMEQCDAFDPSKRRMVPAFSQSVADDTASDTASGVSLSVSTTASRGLKYMMLQGTEKSLKTRLATLVLVELDAPEIDGYLLSGFVEQVLNVGRTHESVTLQVVGTGVLLAWNTHVPYPIHTTQGVNCALALAKVLRQKYNDATPDNPIWWGVSVVRGQVQVGIAGLDKYRASIVIGDPVGLVAALSTLGRRLKCHVVASSSVFEKVRSTIKGRPIDVISVPPNPDREQTGTTTVYELMEWDCGTKYRKVYTEGFSAITDSRFSEATASFTNYLQSLPGDDQALRLLRISLKGDYDDEIFCRRSLGWQDLECGSETVELPQPVMEALKNKDSSMKLIESSADGESSLGTSGDHSLMERYKCNMNTMQVRRLARRQPPQNFKTNTATRQNNWLRSKKSLGAGGYGEVALGMEQGEGTLAACKIVKLPITQNSQTDSRLNKQIEELQKEVDFLNELRHECVVSYLGSEVCDSFVIIVMEYVAGGSLDGVIKDFGALPLSVVKRYISNIVSGLAFLHRNNIVHRDLKPHNVLMTQDGQCKLGDFGAAAKLMRIANDDPNKPQQTKIVGTPLYMAPEACRGQTQSESDIWAVGIVLIELAHGKLHITWDLSEGYNVQAFTFRLGSDETMMPRIPEGLHDEVVGFVKKCINRDPEMRLSAKKLLKQPFLLG
eukprot:TRINITY_DN6795_c0_g3_i1.p1 TRINITY_DN6795_c0_g3~~TRINITY_DN6795_c0_g3_i1.p1  ORF type:complete len:1208 (+),score=245.21 TRINITY_DN6795_c0_g3_i1:32-3655(+)